MDLAFIIFFGYGHYSLVMDINLFKRSHLNQLAAVISDVLLLFFLHAWKLEFGTYLSSIGSPSPWKKLFGNLADIVFSINVDVQLFYIRTLE